MRQSKKPHYEPLGIWDATLRQDYSGYLQKYGTPKQAQPAPRVKKPRRGKGAA